MQSIPTRRDFLTGAVGASVAGLLAPAWLRAQAVAEDARIAEVLAGVVGVDMHNHVTPGGVRPEQGRREQQKSEPGLDLAAEIMRSGLTAVCAAFRLPFNASEPCSIFLQGLTAIDGLMGKDGLTRALSLKDLQTAHNEGRPAIVQSIEGRISSKAAWNGWKKYTSAGCAISNCCTTRGTGSNRSATSTPSPPAWAA